jgi:putative transposase
VNNPPSTATRTPSSGPEGKWPAAGSDAVAESLFATLKKELVHTRPWPTRKDLTDAITDWIDNYYNTQRRHSTLNYLTPREHAPSHRDIKELAA